MRTLNGSRSIAANVSSQGTWSPAACLFNFGQELINSLRVISAVNKYQIANFKFQINSKQQATPRLELQFFNLKFIWDLSFEI